MIDDTTPKGRSDLIKKEKVMAWEKKHRPLGPGDVVLFRSDYTDRYYKPLPAGRRFIADALELNIYHIPTDMDLSSLEVEQNYLDILRAVRSAIHIPVAVKLSPFFTNFANMAKRLDLAGANALVLFNRFYQPDIDLESLEIKPNILLSTPMAMRVPLRWVALLYGKLRASLASTSGMHRASDVLKMLMAGADVTMLCSALIRHGPRQISIIERDLVAWMQEHEYTSVAQLKGSMSQRNCADPSAFERAQYMRAISQLSAT
jgi:dihydroorotate dehydrogenase (fumarate)